MSAFSFIIFLFVFPVLVGGLALLLITQKSKSKNYTPSMIALGRLMAIGVPIFFSADAFLSVYARHTWFAFACFIIEVLIVAVLAYYYSLKLKRERDANLH